MENKLASLDAVSSKRAKVKLDKKVAQLEETFDRLEIQKSELEKQLWVHTLTPEQIADIKAFDSSESKSRLI